MQLTDRLIFSLFFPRRIMTASLALQHACPLRLFRMFVPYDTYITFPWLQKISVLPSSRNTGSKRPAVFQSNICLYLALNQAACFNICRRFQLPPSTILYALTVAQIHHWFQENLHKWLQRLALAFQVALAPFMQVATLTAWLGWSMTDALILSIRYIIRYLME